MSSGKKEEKKSVYCKSTESGREASEAHVYIIRAKRLFKHAYHGLQNDSADPCRVSTHNESCPHTGPLAPVASTTAGSDMPYHVVITPERRRKL